MNESCLTLFYGSLEVVLLETIFQALQVEPDFENLSIDSTTIKAHQHIVGSKKNAPGHEVNQHIGVSRGGKITKLHTVVDGLGNPLAFLLTGGQVYDSVPAIDLLQKLDITGSHIHGDKAYGSEAIRNWITTKQASYTITPKRIVKTHGKLIGSSIKNDT